MKDSFDAYAFLAQEELKKQSVDDIKSVSLLCSIKHLTSKDRHG